MQTRKLGPFTVSAIGLGAMPLSMGANVRPDEQQAIATVHAALDAGVRFIDTADIYAGSWDTMGHNEKLVAKALASWGGDRDSIVVGTKGGITRGAGESWGRDGSPEYLASAVEKSRRNLQVDVIDLYQWHRPDHYRAYSQVIEVLADLKATGKIKAIGVSNVDNEQIEVAVKILGDGELASVQNQFSPSYRSSQPTLDACVEHGIAFLPWSPLGGTGSPSKEVGSRFAVINEIAQRHQVSPQRVVLAWELSLDDVVIPIPGASRPESIVDSARASELQLSAADRQTLTELNRGIS